MKLNLMILSTDAHIKAFLRTEFAEIGMPLHVDINSTSAARDLLQKNKINILIVDADTKVVLSETVKDLMENHDVHFIIMGIKNAATLISAGVQGAVSKPDENNNFAHKVLFRNLLDRVEMYTRSASSANMLSNNTLAPALNISTAADINSKVIAIASSTGGTEALHTLLSALPAQVPPILIVQHMPKEFTFQFAGRLNQASKFTVKEASVRDVAKKNLALIAPGGLHMKAVMHQNKLTVECFDCKKVHGVIPAADILFESLANFMGKTVIGVVLTGMGSDGARGLFKLKSKGATIIAQDKESSVVYGMPKAAADLGIVDFQLPLTSIAEKIISLI